MNETSGTPVGKTRDAGFEIGVSRTVPHPPEAVWEFLLSDAGLAVWLGDGARLADTAAGAELTADGGTTGEVRSYKPGDRVRLRYRPGGWTHETTVQITVRPAARGGSKVTMHQEWLAGPAERDAQRTHWEEVHARLATALDERSG